MDLERVEDRIDAEASIDRLWSVLTDTEAAVCQMIMNDWEMSEITAHFEWSDGHVNYLMYNIRKKARAIIGGTIWPILLYNDKWVQLLSEFRGSGTAPDYGCLRVDVDASGIEDSPPAFSDPVSLLISDLQRAKEAYD